MFTLKDVVPWGRSGAEYRQMFALTDQDLRRRLLGCADGPASFNAELTALGGHVVSCDPLYRFNTEQIRQRIDETFATVMDQTRQNLHEFLWCDDIPNVETLSELRMSAMQRFLEDYAGGQAGGRYITGELPNLQFQDAAFDLALCSHFLFLYADRFSAEFHLASIRELCRVSREVRVFPLVELGSVPSRHLSCVIEGLKTLGLDARVEQVPYEFQRGGNQMLRVGRQSDAQTPIGYD